MGVRKTCGRQQIGESINIKSTIHFENLVSFIFIKRFKRSLIRYVRIISFVITKSIIHLIHYIVLNV